MNAPSAWTISAAMAAAQSALSRLEASGDVDTDEAAALAVLREEAPDIDDVIARLLRARGEARAYAEALDARVDDLTQRRDRYARQSEEYRRTVFAIMDALGVRKWQSAEFTVSVSDGRPGVVITDESAIPPKYFRPRVEIDRTEIRRALEAGETVPGAEIANGMPTMTVRTK